MIYRNIIYFQSPNSFLILNIINLFNLAVAGCVFVGIFTILIFLKLIINKFLIIYLSESYYLEIIWTIIPILILFIIGVPSIHLLYIINEIIDPKLSVKITANQWYWNYEYNHYENSSYNSYLAPTFIKNQFYLLDVDNRLVLPYLTHIRSLITRSDVLHSWTLPSLGVKIDAIPGRINQFPLFINKPGIYYGQCREICGAYHSFIPIVLEAVNVKSYINFIQNF